jgi:hypothetical protein
MAVFTTPGTKLQIKGADLAMHDIEGVRNLDIGAVQADEIDTTAISSTAYTSIAGFKDSGRVTGTMLFDPADTYHTQMLTSYKSTTTTDDFTIVFSDPGNCNVTFSGVVDQFEWSFSGNDAVLVNFGVKITTVVTVTP